MSLEALLAMKLPALRELVTARLGAGAVSLAVGGSAGRTKKDLAAEVHAKLMQGGAGRASG